MLLQVGQAMCAPGADAQVHAHILGHYTQQLVKPGLSQRETAVAVEAIGALAASTNRFFEGKVGFLHRIILGFQDREKAITWNLQGAVQLVAGRDVYKPGSHAHARVPRIHMGSACIALSSTG